MQTKNIVIISIICIVLLFVILYIFLGCSISLEGCDPSLSSEGAGGTAKEFCDINKTKVEDYKPMEIAFKTEIAYNESNKEWCLYSSYSIRGRCTPPRLPLCYRTRKFLKIE